MTAKSPAQIAVAALFVLLLMGQTVSAKSFPSDEFEANLETAQWILDCWRIQDEAEEFVDELWFERVDPLNAELERYLVNSVLCLRLDGRWHTFHGRYDDISDTYRLIWHLEQSPDGGLRQSDRPVDMDRVTALARVAGARIHENVSFRRFERFTQQGTIEAYDVPESPLHASFSEETIYGGEITFEYDQDGRVLLAESVNHGGLFMALADPETVLEIDRRENRVPSVGDILVALVWAHAFKDVAIFNKNFTTVARSLGDGEMDWSHEKARSEPSDRTKTIITEDCELVGKPADGGPLWTRERSDFEEEVLANADPAEPIYDPDLRVELQTLHESVLNGEASNRPCGTRPWFPEDLECLRPRAMAESDNSAAVWIVTVGRDYDGRLVEDVVFTTWRRTEDGWTMHCGPLCRR